MARPVPNELRRRRRRGTGRNYVTDQGYRVITAIGHPLADRSGRAYEHRVVLFAKIGEGPHTCHWCGRRVDWTADTADDVGRLVVDHLDDDRLHNDPKNLVPSCTRCNSERKRNSRFLTHCVLGHEYSDEDYIRSDGTRNCRTCQRVRDFNRRRREGKPMRKMLPKGGNS